MIKLAVSGCQGRMGQRITQLALADRDFAVTTLLEHQGNPKVNEKINGLPIHTAASALKGCDVLIEFTTPEATLEHLAACVQYGVKMVIGTTGLDPAQIEAIKKASAKIPVVFSSNMSVGVNLVFKLTELAAAQTAKTYTVTMEEAHHIHKKDAPSGTAKTLAQIVEAASGVKVADIKSIREGEIVGDHTVTFESAEDVITISHHAKNRDIFAKGSLVAAKFLAKKKKGLFDMQDVLGLK
ncbi:MAG: 4-hydroxy-tetrahydrodipicolinate reductase [Candidatus Omnitrophica bacterium]|nr:4-hydroxy-tetrahydrodipicolinate reductase [Candidatus Omnitrophota bacterium]